LLAAVRAVSRRFRCSRGPVAAQSLLDYSHEHSGEAGGNTLGSAFLSLGGLARRQATRRTSGSAPRWIRTVGFLVSIDVGGGKASSQFMPDRVDPNLSSQSIAESWLPLPPRPARAHLGPA